MTPQEWQPVWIAARLANVLALQIDLAVYGECFMDARTGWRIDPREVVLCA